jgi:hypothetical protein
LFLRQKRLNHTVDFFVLSKSWPVAKRYDDLSFAPPVPKIYQRILMPIGIVIIAIVAVAAGSISQVLKIWLNRPGRAVLPQTDLREIRDGLGQLQQAIDAIAVEVERLSEGQRFTTKLLSEQARKIASAPSVDEHLPMQ